MGLSRCGPVPAAAAIIALAVSACGSASTSGQDAARQTQDRVVTAGRALYLKFFDAKVASNPAMSGNYLPCTAGSGGTKKYYDVSFSLFPVDRNVSLDAYRQQLVGLARAGGWKVSAGSTADSAGTDGTRYSLAKGSLNGSLSVLHGVSPKVEASASVDSACFDAGSAASGLANHDKDFPLPHVSASGG